MGKVFSTRQKGPEGSDCTAPYTVTLHGMVTLRSFVDAVLGRRTDWGHISIYDGKKERHAGYDHGKMESRLPDALLDREVRHASASGGWTRMDYVVELD